MKRHFLLQALMFFIIIKELPCSTPRNQCPYKLINGCTTVTVVKPGCRYNYVYPQKTYTAAINIKSCVQRNLLRIYWTVRNNGKRFFLFQCRQRLKCSLQDNKINGSFFVMEAQLFILNTAGTKKLQSILVPISFSKMSLTTVKDLVNRKLMKVTDALRMFEYMLPTLNSKSSNSVVVRNELISRIRIYLQNQSVDSTTRNTKPGAWIPIGRPNNSSNVSVLVVPSAAQTPGDAISNGIKALLTKENFTEAHLAKLTQIVRLMAASIMGQVESNPSYNKEKINSQIQNRTIQIWELLKKMNKTAHKTHPKMFTEAHWSEWGNWSPCSKNCKGKTFSTRSRTCFVNEDTYKPCKGHSSEVKKCPCLEEVLLPKPKPTGPSVIHGQWTPWGSWSQCSVTCGLGNEQSYRKCHSNRREFTHGKTIIKCKGSRKKTRACIMAACEGTTEAEYKIFQGNNASLSCKSLDRSVHKSMYWVGPRGKRYKAGKKIGRISVTKDGKLHIKRALVGDEGTYYCIIPVLNRNIVGNAQITILTCQDDPCMNRGTCIERKYEIISKPSSFVCLCTSGYYGTFCQKASKKLRSFMIIVPVCAGLVLMLCIITMAAIRLRKTKKDCLKENAPKWNKKDRIKPSYRRENSKRSKKLSKEVINEDKSKINKSVVSGDDSLQEIEEKDIEHILSPQKSRKANVSYKRQSVRDPVQKKIFVKTNPGKDKVYPSTPEELQNWYTSPQANAEFYNSPMDINVYENVSSTEAARKEPVYENLPYKLPNTANQKDLKMKPVLSMKMDDKEYEDMYLPFAEGNQMQYPNMRDFTLIHKSLTPSRKTRSYPNDDIQFSDDRNRSNMLDEPFFQEKNVSNINTETGKYCHPSDICGRKSLRLNLRNVIQSISQDDILEPSHSENLNSGLKYHRYQPKGKSSSATEEREPDYVFNFYNSGGESTGTKNEEISPIVEDRTKRMVYIQDMSKSKAARDHYTREIREKTSTPLLKQGKDDAVVIQRQDFQQFQKNVYAVPSSKRLQSSSLSLSDTQMRKAIGRVELKEKVVLNQKGSKSFTEENSDDEHDIVYHRKYLKKKNRQESMIDDEADKIASLRSAERFKQYHRAIEDNLHGSDRVEKDQQPHTASKQELAVGDTRGSISTPSQNQSTGDEDRKLDQSDDIRQFQHSITSVNSSKDLQSPAMRNRSSSLDMRNALQSEDFDDEVIFNNHKSKCFTQEEDDDEQEIIYHRKCLVKSSKPENKIDYEATKIELKKALNQPRKPNGNEEEKRSGQIQSQSTIKNVSNENSTDSVNSDETNSSTMSVNFQKSLENDSNNTEEYHTPEAKTKLQTENSTEKHDQRDSTPTNSEVYQEEQSSSQFNETSELIEQLSPRSRMCLHHYQMVYGTMGYKSPKSNTDEESP
ncbi:uncharacterized protein LOC134228666 [Saccostrea cucullata]|uniref:uncharacterized protein LOC134228666 n=1 Tax=Saccostrea cuccullata TaxID=36930 RepID=UPI002ED0F75A